MCSLLLFIVNTLQNCQEILRIIFSGRDIGPHFPVLFLLSSPPPHVPAPFLPLLLTTLSLAISEALITHRKKPSYQKEHLLTPKSQVQETSHVESTNQFYHLLGSLTLNINKGRSKKEEIKIKATTLVLRQGRQTPKATTPLETKTSELDTTRF